MEGALTLQACYWFIVKPDAMRQQWEMLARTQNCYSLFTLCCFVSRSGEKQKMTKETLRLEHDRTVHSTSKKPVSTTIWHKPLMAYNSGSSMFCESISRCLVWNVTSRLITTHLHANDCVIRSTIFFWYPLFLLHSGTIRYASYT